MKRSFKWNWSELCRKPPNLRGRIFFFLSFFTLFGEGGAERDGERIPSRLHAVSTEPSVRLDPMNHEIMTWAEIKSWTLNWLSHAGTPMIAFFKPPDIEDFHGQATDRGEGKKGWTLKSQRHTAFKPQISLACKRCPWRGRDTPETEVRSQKWILSVINSVLLHCFSICQHPPLLQRALSTNSG